jgi:dihydroxyacetone kinase-like protein
MDCIDAAYASIRQHADEIMVLDQTIGDGDHVFNLIRGFEALRGIRRDIEALDSGPALKLAASKVLSTVGGSSGPLFASLLLGMSRASGHLNGHPCGYAQMYAAGVKAVQDRGKTGKGSKTMMDVLIPVAERLSALADGEPAVPLILAELPKEAARGMLATRDMLATKGRASFLGERSLGHIDPGARSSEIMITAVCERIGKSCQSGRAAPTDRPDSSGGSEHQAEGRRTAEGWSREAGCGSAAQSKRGDVIQ